MIITAFFFLIYILEASIFGVPTSSGFGPIMMPNLIINSLISASGMFYGQKMGHPHRDLEENAQVMQERA